MNIQVVNLEILVAFWLAFSRCLAVIFQLPIFDGMTIPSIVKAMTTGASFSIPVPVAPQLLTTSSAMANSSTQPTSMPENDVLISDTTSTMHNRRSGQFSTSVDSKLHED